MVSQQVQLPNYCSPTLLTGYPKAQMRKAWEKLHGGRLIAGVSCPCQRLDAILTPRGAPHVRAVLMANCAATHITL